MGNRCKGRCDPPESHVAVDARAASAYGRPRLLEVGRGGAARISGRDDRVGEARANAGLRGAPPEDLTLDDPLHRREARISPTRRWGGPDRGGLDGADGHAVSGWSERTLQYHFRT